MQFLSGHTYHIYNQGNNGQQLFFERENYVFFLKKVKKNIGKHAHILSWCLMPNHFHLLVQVKPEYEGSNTGELITKIGALNRGIGILQSSYTQALNKKINRSGSMFRSRAKAKPLDEDIGKNDSYGINCFLYIHQNPVRAGLVTKLEDWEFSSYQDYAGLRNGTLCNKEIAKDLLKLPSGYSEFEKFSYQTIPKQFLRLTF